MAVVINDFEVVADAPPGGGAAPRAAAEQQDGGSGGASAPGLTPNDLRRVLRREIERTERVRAD